MTVTYNPGDRVTIDWSKIDRFDEAKIDEFELRYFEYGEECIGTIERVENGYAIIIWDKKYHPRMYGDNGKQWNLEPKILKYVEDHHPMTQEEKILLRIKKTYSKSNLSFVKQWSK